MIEPGSGPVGPTLALPEGLVGLPLLRRFALRAVPDTALVELVSLDDEAFGFVAASGDDVRPGLTGELVTRGFAPAGSQTLVLLSVHGDPPSVTANVAGPIVVEPGGTGRQIVLEGPEYPLRLPLGGAA